jgi:hypothetical protein
MFTHRLVTVDGRVTDPWPADEAALRPDSAGESADLFGGELAVGVEDDSSGRVLTLARPNPEGPAGVAARRPGALTTADLDTPLRGVSISVAMRSRAQPLARATPNGARDVAT